jgi:hypothetical protein
MKLLIERIVERDQREGIVWGATPEGNAVLVIVVGSERVILEMTPGQAERVGVGGCYVATGLATASAPAEQKPQSMLVGRDGLPIGRG